jgi:serine/threonine-protein kinase
LFWQTADGSGAAERLTAETDNLVTNPIPKSWSPDGQLLAFQRIDPTTQRDIWIFSLSDRKVRLFRQTPFTEGSPQFSRDGRWLSYVSNESGRPEIYVQPYPGPGGKWQVSTDGGNEPVWGRTGEIFYRSGNKMMAVEVTTQPTFSAGKPRVLFEKQYLASPFPQTGPAYDVTADGQRFLMVRQLEQPGTPISVVLNWIEDLKRRAPAGKQ